MVDGRIEEICQKYNKYKLFQKATIYYCFLIQPPMTHNRNMRQGDTEHRVPPNLAVVYQPGRAGNGLCVLQQKHSTFATQF
jgi:hypothetical protein